LSPVKTPRDFLEKSLPKGLGRYEADLAADVALRIARLCLGLFQIR
jgi:hypothetical protein